MSFIEGPQKFFEKFKREVAEVLDLNSSSKPESQNTDQPRILFLENALRKKNEEIEQLKKKIDEQKNEIETDGLTGVYRRCFFDQALNIKHEEYRRYVQKEPTDEKKKAEEKERQVSVAMIDLDLFKDVNDTYGHAVGDAVLQKAAELFSKHKREVDFVARWGGEEFVILFLGKFDADQMKVVAQRLMEAFKKPLHVTVDGKEYDIPMTFSMGVATNILEHETKESQVTRADEAMYQAKGGKDLSDEQKKVSIEKRKERKQKGISRCVIAIGDELIDFTYPEEKPVTAEQLPKNS